MSDDFPDLTDSTELPTPTPRALTAPVLVLNRGYHAVRITGGKMALSMLYAERVSALSPDYTPHAFEDWREHCQLVEESDRRIQTIRGPIDVPEIILLKEFAEVPKTRLRLSRRNVFIRDGHECVYCGSPEELTIDHVLPRSRGGPSTWENLVTCCRPCNTEKGARTPEEVGFTIPRRPARPKLAVDVRFSRVQRPPASWEPFLKSA